MKKTNKILSLVISTAMAFSFVCSTGISASADAEMIVYKDNFDTGKTRENSTSYPVESYAGDSTEVLAYNAGYSAICVQEIGVNEDESVNKVIKASHYRVKDGVEQTINDKVALQTREITYNTGEVIRFSMDIRFNSLSTQCTNASGNNERFFYMLRNVKGKGGFALNETSDGADGAANKLQAYNAGDSAYLTPDIDKWYRAIATVGADGSYTTSILDPETDEIVLSNTVDSLYDQGDIFQINPIHFVKIRQGSSTMLYTIDNYTVVQVDNAEIAIYNPSELPAKVTKASIENPSSEISRNAEISFSFDQAVSGDLILKKGGETVEGVTTDYNTTRDKVTLNYGGMLDRNTTYTISFAEILNDGDLPCEYPDVTFTTEDLHIWNDIEIDAPTSDGTNTEVTFTLGECYGYEVVSGGMMAMLYRDNKLIAIDMVGLDNEDITSAVTESFNFGQQPQTGDTVRLMLMDIEESFVPFAVGSIVIE